MAPEARTLHRPSRSYYRYLRRRLLLAQTAIPARFIERAASDYPAAERCFREGHDELRAIGERAYRSIISSLLAEALYTQGRFDEAQQMSEEAQAAVVADDLVQLDWKVTQAKPLARRGQIPAARQLINQVQAALLPHDSLTFKARVLEGQAEVSRLTGDPRQAEQHLNAALRIYEDIGHVPFAQYAKAAIASLTAQAHYDP